MKQKQKPFVAYGIVSAIVAILFLLVLYLGGIKWFMHPVAYFGYLFPIVLAAIAAQKQKELNGGYLNFSEALKGVFLVFVITAAATTLFSFILFNYIDVAFREALNQRAAEVAGEFMRKFGASEDDIDKAMEEAMSGNPNSPGKMLLGFAFYCIIWFIIALIVA
ncbi:MAG: DUF4199 domain-containing protein, partial [Chitinophagaceae bacterium]